jgi:hypothetical protein
MNEELERAINSFLSKLKFSGKSEKNISAYSFLLAKLKAFISKRGLDFRLINGKEAKEF